MSWIAFSLLLNLLGVNHVEATLSARKRAPTNTSGFGDYLSHDQENEVNFSPHTVAGTAADHRHRNPDLALLGFTQHLLKAIKEGKKKCTGLLESGRHDYELAMEFSFDLSNKLVSLDDIGVSHFNSGSEFIAKSGHEGLQVGNVLLGSLIGRWAQTTGSIAGMHSSSDQLNDLPHDMMKGSASRGGLAHLSVIRSVTPQPDGTMKIATSKNITEKIFHAGRVAVGWNHTKMTRRRRTDEEVDLLIGADKSRRRLYNPGVCDSLCPEGVLGNTPSDYAYDRIGGCTKDFLGYCNGGYESNDDDSEFCYYCFEYVKEIKTFDFNYNGNPSDPGPLVANFKLATNVDCVNCWAYLGSTAFVVIDWSDDNSLKTAEIGITGGAGYGYTVKTTGQGADLSDSTTTTLSSVPKCVFGPIAISSILTITPTCILESTVTGTFTGFVGDLEATANYQAFTLMKAGYSDGQWSGDKSTSYSATDPDFAGSVTAGTFKVEYVLRPKVQLSISVELADLSIAKVVATGSVALTPTIEADVSSSESRRRLEEGSPEKGSFEIKISETLERGKVVNAELTSLTRHEHVVFKLSAPSCWDDRGSIVLNEVTVPQGSSTIGLPIPWHLYLTACQEYVIEAYEVGSRNQALVSEPFPMNMGPCMQERPLIFEPSHGEVLNPDGAYTIKWDASQLFFFAGRGMSHLGHIVPVKHVQLSLVGKLPETTCVAEKLPLAQNCEETILIGDTQKNSGHFLFDFSTNSDGLGNPVVPWARYQHLRVQIAASDHSLTSHTSENLISFDGSENVNDAKCLNKSPSNKASSFRFLSKDLVTHHEPPTNRRMTTTGSLSTSFSLGMEANFKSIVLSLFGGYGAKYTLWSDSNVSPDLSFDLIPSTAVLSGATVWTSPSGNEEDSSAPGPSASSSSGAQEAGPQIAASSSDYGVDNDDADDDDAFYYADDDQGFYGYYSAYYDSVDDDTVATAIPTASLVCGSPANGNITTASNYYELILTGHTILTLSTCNSVTSFDSILALYGESRNITVALNDDDSSCGHGGRLSTFVSALPPGTYLVRVMEYGQEYELSTDDGDDGNSLAYYDDAGNTNGDDIPVNPTPQPHVAYYDDAGNTNGDDIPVNSTPQPTSHGTSGGAFQVDVTCVAIPDAVGITADDVKTGTIQANDYNLYTFSVSDNTYIHASTCDTESDFDSKLFLLESDCATLIAQNDDDIACSAGNMSNALSTVSSKVDEGRDVCLKVAGFGSASGKYKLTLVTTAANQPTLAPTDASGCLKTCRGQSCSDIDEMDGTAGGYCDYAGEDLVAQFGCSCAECDCSTQGVSQFSLTMVMNAAVIPAGTVVSYLQSTIATALGVSTLAFHSFKISSVETTTRRRLTTDYEWNVAFQLSVSLGATSSPDAASLADVYQTSLTTTDFTAVDSTLTLSSASSVVVTPGPTQSPVVAVPQPPAIPTTPAITARGGKRNINSASTSTIVLAVVLSFVGCLACMGAGVVVFRRHQASFRNLLAVNYKHESEKTWGEATAGAATDNSKTKAAEFDDYGVEMNEASPGNFDGADEGRMSTNPLFKSPGQGTIRTGVPTRNTPGGTNV